MTERIHPDVLAALMSVEEIITRARRAWKPSPKLTLSEWADREYVLSAESSAQSGKWTTIPYQKGIMDAFTDRRVISVSVMKSARVGWTKIVNAFVGYSIHHDPASMMVVQPTVEDAKGYSKEEIAPMLRDVPALAAIVIEDAEDKGPRDSGNTILHKKFPGGVLQFVGANSGAGFRRVSRKRVLFDEVDAYPASAGSEGDPVKLGSRRAAHFWDKKIGAGSTPLIAGHSRIEELFNDGDQRRYYVPCPSCGHFDHFVFRKNETTLEGHYMSWTAEDGSDAHFVCSKNGCVIEHNDKRKMVEAGEWRAAKPFKGHASFHIWEAYSYSPDAEWKLIAADWISSNREGRDKLKTFINTRLGQTWRESGEAPEWERLFARREPYVIGSVPPGVVFLTAGVDVQKDRFVYEVVGWGAGKESWSIDAGVIPVNSTADEECWLKLDELLERKFDGRQIEIMAVDSGYNTSFVYIWGRRHERNRVIAVKGVATQRTLLSPPTPVDVNHNGRRIARGYKVWPVGVDLAKSELYGWLRLPAKIIDVEGQKPLVSYPAGFAHFPELSAEFFRQLTAEQLVSIKHKRTSREILEWQVIPGRENHYLDCRVYARVAAAVYGLDWRTMPETAPTEQPKAEPESPASSGSPAAPTAPLKPALAPAPQRRPIQDSTSSWSRGMGWFTRR